MLLHLDSRGGGTYLTAHITDFKSFRASALWRRSARRALADFPGLAWATAMPCIGSRASAGFAPGWPAARRQVLLTAWRRELDFESFLAHRAARAVV